MKKWKWRFVQAVVLILAVSAVVVCRELIKKHLTGHSGSAWFDAGCPLDAKPGGANCAAVLKSPYGTLTLGKKQYPVALLGSVYYSALIVWLVAVGRPTYDRRWFHLVPVLLVAGGLTGSVYFIYIMFAKLNEWCSWCLVTHGLNVLIAAGVVWMWPRAKEVDGSVSPTSDPSLGAESGRNRFAAPSRPTWRVALAAILGMIVVGYGERELIHAAQMVLTQQRTTMEGETFKQFYVRIRNEPNLMLGLWNAAAPKEVPVRPDDPIRVIVQPDDRPLLDLIIFSDLECPSCKTTAQFLEEKIQPLFAGRLRVIFKHFPLDQSCNAEIGGTLHKNACLAARIAEAARLQGGSAAFWKAHDLLFSRQQPGTGLQGVDPAEVAAALGLNPGRLAADVNAETVTQRITEDTKEGKKAGIWSTPLIVVHGKPVDGLMAKEIGYWDGLADLYWQSIQVPRPEQSRLKKATP